MAGFIEEIASASGTQSDKVEQIQAAVAEMDKVAQQNMAEAEELSAAMAVFKTEEYKVHIPRRAELQSRHMTDKIIKTAAWLHKYPVP